MDPIETAAVRDDMERLHVVSRETAVQAVQVLLRISEETMHWRAEQARQALADGHAAAAEQAARFRAERDLAAATWDARLRDPAWFADAPVAEILQTWTSAEGWAQTGDPRAVATCERLRLQVRRLGVDPDLAQSAVAAQDLQALTDLLDAPAEHDPPAGDRAGPPTGPAHAPGSARTSRQEAARNAHGLTQAQHEAVTELVRSSMHPEAATAILADKEWPRVAGQLHRAQQKVAEFNTANPNTTIDLPGLLGSLQFSRPADELRTPAGWLIWQLHNATAAHGVQLIADTHPDGHRVRTRPEPARRPRGNSRGPVGPTRDTAARRDPPRGD